MSDELLHQGHEMARPLRGEEQMLLRALLKSRDDFETLDRQISNGLVRDLPDAGMGSLEFIGEESRMLGKVLARAEYVDSDGVLTSIVVNADLLGKLFELDMWKVDFSALRKYPQPDALNIE